MLRISSTRALITLSFAAAVAALTAGILASHLAQAAPSAVDQPECLGAGFSVARQADPNAQLVASFATTVQTFVTWEETRNPDVKPISPQRGRPPGERLVMCYYDGTYTGIPKPAGNSMEFTRMIVAVMADGTTRVVTVGPKATNPLTGPTP